MLNNCICSPRSLHIATESYVDIRKEIKLGNAKFLLDIFTTTKVCGIFYIYADVEVEKILQDIYCANCGNLFLTKNQFEDIKYLFTMGGLALFGYLDKIKNVK